MMENLKLAARRNVATGFLHSCPPLFVAQHVADKGVG